MPVQAAAGAAIPPAAEETLESVTESNTDLSEEAAPAETVSEAEVTDQGTDDEVQVQETETESELQAQETETESEPQAQAAESESEPQTQETDMSELTADPAEDPELKDELTQDGGAVLTEGSEQKDGSEISETPDEVEGAIAEEAAPASNEETACEVSAENTVSSVSAKAAAGLAAEIDRIHFITLNGSYSDSDAILIESNGKYGLIDSSNPSKASSDPDFAFTSEYVDTAANGLTVVKYLTDLNVSHLEFVLATHSHSDHVGGMVDIANSGLVNNNTVYIYKEYQAVMGESVWHNDYYANLALEAMRAKNTFLLNVLDPSSNAMTALGDNGAALIRDPADRVGDHLEFTMGAILMSDMEQQNFMESRTVDSIIRNDKSFKADVYKVGHHRYSTSTSYDTIETLKPANYVLSTGTRSASPWAYSLYPYFAEKLGGKLYRTSENGSAVIADFGDQNVSIKKLANKALAAPVQWKPVITDGWHPWYPDEDSYNRTGVKWTYFKSGSPLKGWFTVGSNWYFADDHYLMKTGWVNSGGKRFFLNNNGIMQTGWVKYENKWYFLGSNGAMQTGWKLDGGKWYFLNSDGTMQTGRQVIGGTTYFFNGSGAMQTGWIFFGGKWYYANGSGSMQTGWIKDGGTWYYLGSDGTMQTGRKVIGGTTYFFSGSGAMQTGWISFGGKWYYANGSGSMQTGWIKDGSTWYYLGSDGTMQTGRKLIGGKTYFFNGSGVMQTGWINSAGKWYYLDSSGAMVANKWVGDYFLKSNGEMAVNTWIGSYYVGKDGKWIPGAKKAA